MERLALDGHDVLDVVDVKVTTAADARLAHTAGDDGSVGRRAAARRQDADGGRHAGKVLGGGLLANENDLLALAVLLDGTDGIEHDLTDGGSGGGGETLRELGGQVSNDGRVKHGVQQLVDRGGVNAHDGLLLADESLVHHLHGNLRGGEHRALAVAGLEKPKLAVLDRELHILHVAEVALELVADFDEQLVVLGHGLLHGGEILAAALLGNAVLLGPTAGNSGADLLGCAHTSDDVLALGVDEVLTVEAGVAVGGVAGEAHTSGGCVGHVAEDHGLDVDGRAEKTDDVVHLAVLDGAVVEPALEDGVGGGEELRHGVLGEVLAGLLLVEALVHDDDALECICCEVAVLLDAELLLLDRERMLKRNTLDAAHNITVHGDETAVAIIDEALVVRGAGEGGDGLVVEAKVQHRVHHTGHADGGAGADRQQQGHAVVAELAADLSLDLADGLDDLVADRGRECTLRVAVDVAHLRGDREAGGHRDAHVDHFVQVGALAAKQHLHGLVAIRLRQAEEVDVLLIRHCFLENMKR
eukprot:PhM_4_TR16884/c0_g1_i1/m.66076